MALGSPRGKFVYPDDAGNNWIITIAVDLVDAVTPSCGLTIYDPASPPAKLMGRLSPKKCRRVHAQGSVTVAEGGGISKIDIIKRDFICTIGSALYASNNSQKVEYFPSTEGTSTEVDLISTGRRGERITF